MRPGVPIASQVREDDVILDVMRLAIGDGPGPPPGTTLLGRLTQGVDVVALIRTTDVRGELTPAQDWIDSVVTFEPLDVVKDTRGDGASPLRQLTFQGGQLMFGHTLVRARFNLSLPPRPGVTYLAFLTAQGARLRADIHTVLELSGEHLVPLVQTSRFSLENLPPWPAARAEIVAALQDTP